MILDNPYKTAYVTYNSVIPPEEIDYKNEIALPSYLDYTLDPEYLYQLEMGYYDEPTEGIIEESVEEPIEEDKRRKFKRKTAKYDHTISFKLLCDKLGLKVRVTSEFRNNSRTKSGNISNHSRRDAYGQSMAIDVVPVDGDFDKLKNTLLNSPEARNWFEKRGYGILNEINSTVKSQTGATGNHFHIGPDRWALKVWNTWLLNPSMSASQYIASR